MMPDSPIDLLPGVPSDYVLERMLAAGGKEVESGKFSSPESSAALAVNTFAWFTPRPELMPPLPDLPDIGSASKVEVEYCARFPWNGGRHPWLDAAIFSPTHLVGVESKRFEPFRDAKSVALSPAYDRPVWGDQMTPYEIMRDRLRSGEARFIHLDAAQLVKHAFGLVTDARRSQRRPILYYIFAEPLERNARPIPDAARSAHRLEIAAFAAAVAGGEVAFAAASYREWLASWPSNNVALLEHREAILAGFQP